MVKFPFDLRGYQYQSSVDVLRKSAEMGLAALGNEIRTLEQQLEDYSRAGEFDGEFDEDGVVLWERDKLLEYEIAFANDALMELRKAFAIAAYHHWERSVQIWIAHKSKAVAADVSDVRKGKQGRGYEYFSNAAREMGYPVDVELLRVLTLANTLKHNSRDRGEELLASWPDIFPQQFKRPANPSDWASAIRLSDEHLNEIFNIVSRSGPTASFI